jgi:transcriptional regulator with XRE-family HTH domain
MTKLRLDLLAEDVRRCRGMRGVRTAAREIGCSAATVSRIENHFAPDLGTFAKVCRWLAADPWRYLGKARS